MKIFLIGLPGSGKSTIGKELAALLNKRFIDLDDEISESEGSSIREIFLSKGESNFRLLERDQLHKCINNFDSFVMATGGGVPVFHDNMQFMNDHGITVFLNTPIEIVVQRMTTSQLEERPLFSGTSNINQRLTELLTARIVFYKMAKLEVGGTAAARDVMSLLSNT